MGIGCRSTQSEALPLCSSISTGSVPGQIRLTECCQTMQKWRQPRFSDLQTVKQESPNHPKQHGFEKNIKAFRLCLGFCARCLKPKAHDCTGRMGRSRTDGIAGRLCEFLFLVSSNKCHASSNKCLTSSNKKLLELKINNLNLN